MPSKMNFALNWNLFETNNQYIAVQRSRKVYFGQITEIKYINKSTNPLAYLSFVHHTGLDNEIISDKLVPTRDKPQ